MDDVKEMEKIVSTHHVRKIPLSISLRVGVWCRHTWFESLDSDSFFQNSKFVGSGNVSQCWTSAFDDHDNRCCLKGVEHRTDSEKTSRLRQHNRHCIIQYRRAGLEPWSVFFGCLFGGVSRNRSPCTLSLDFFNLLGEEWKHFNHEIPQIESWNPIYA